MSGTLIAARFAICSATWWSILAEERRGNSRGSSDRRGPQGRRPAVCVCVEAGLGVTTRRNLLRMHLPETWTVALDLSGVHDGQNKTWEQDADVRTIKVPVVSSDSAN